MGKPIDLTGQKFGRLTVVKRVEDHVSKCGRRQTKWLCQCDCGNLCEGETIALRHGDKKSCGCLKSEKSSMRMIARNIPKYGANITRGNRLYQVWCSMRQRCNNPNDHGYKYYGARGITVCDDWSDFRNFQKWALENGYKKGLSIDRINNDKGYFPENCRWVDRYLQARNTRANHIIEYKGKAMTLREWAKRTGISEKTLSNRILSGWPIERVLTEPVNAKFRRKS